jgi:hypothetical protein
MGLFHVAVSLPLGDCDMRKSFRYARHGDTTLCTVTYENGLSHAAIGKHPNERIAQKLAYKALQAYVKRFSLDNLRAIREDEPIQWEVRDGKPIRSVRVTVDGKVIVDQKL